MNQLARIKMLAALLMACRTPPAWELLPGAEVSDRPSSTCGGGASGGDSIRRLDVAWREDALRVSWVTEDGEVGGVSRDGSEVHRIGVRGAPVVVPVGTTTFAPDGTAWHVANEGAEFAAWTVRGKVRERVDGGPRLDDGGGASSLPAVAFGADGSLVAAWRAVVAPRVLSGPHQIPTAPHRIDVHVARMRNGAWDRALGGREALVDSWQPDGDDGGRQDSTRYPVAVAIGPDDAPWIAWSTGGHLRVRRWTGTHWEAVPDPAAWLPGRADRPAITRFGGGVALAWAHKWGGGYEPAEIRVALWDGSQWLDTAPGPDAVSGTMGHSTDPVLAADGSRLAVAWRESYEVGEARPFTSAFVREWDGNFWTAAWGEPCRGGLAATPFGAHRPWIAIEPDGVPLLGWTEAATALRWSGETIHALRFAPAGPRALAPVPVWSLLAVATGAGEARLLAASTRDEVAFLRPLGETWVTEGGPVPIRANRGGNHAVAASLTGRAFVTLGIGTEGIWTFGGVDWNGARTPPRGSGGTVIGVLSDGRAITVELGRGNPTVRAFDGAEWASLGETPCVVERGRISAITGAVSGLDIGLVYVPANGEPPALCRWDFVRWTRGPDPPAGGVLATDGTRWVLATGPEPELYELRGRDWVSLGRPLSSPCEGCAHLTATVRGTRACLAWDRPVDGRTRVQAACIDSETDPTW